MAGARMLHRAKALIGRFGPEDGQALVEYSLLLLMVAVAAIGAVRVFGVGVSTLYQSIVDVVPVP